MIIGLFTELSAAGGVQRAGRLTALALERYAAMRNETCTFLSLNDERNSPAVRVGSQEIAFSGFGRSKRAFLIASLRAALQKPKLVAAFHPHLAPVVAAMKLLSPRSRTIVFTHGIEVWTQLKLTRRWPLRRCDLVLGPSEDTLRQLVAQQGVARARMKKLRWSLGPEFDANAGPCAHCPPPDGFPKGRIILTVGRWDAQEAYKGVDHLILSLPALLSDLPDLQLVAVGDGTDLPRLKRIAEEQHVASRVHFLTRMQPAQLSGAYAACSVFALPSRGEGFGLVFLEAMSCAKPVIGGAHGGTPEIIEDGASGYLVPYGDVALLTERLRALLSDEARRLQMGQQALERVRSNFTYTRFCAEFTNLLDSVLAVQASQAPPHD